MSFAKRSVLVVAIMMVVIGAGWIWLNRQYLQDWRIVQSFTPTAEVAAIPERAGMSEEGKFLFYASRPLISDASEFNNQCARQETSAAILGCFDGANIYLYHVENVDLDGITEVTAAHEMLHAAWSRLGEREKERLQTHLEKVYDRVKTDELEERMAYYDRQQPGERINELHSILATEITMLDDVLEQHYARYFTDRQSVVSLHGKYAAIFNTLKSQSESLRREIATLLEALNADITAHNAAVAGLEAEILAHNDRATSVDNTNGEAVRLYNQTQASLMARRAQLRQDEAALARRQDEYQQKVQEYNKLVIRSETLTDSMDSLKSPQSAAK
ncbi:MAG TPA: hypothetical protein PKD28_03975 [Candidatus Saccharibacteria bacterium]|nr:hypothetical protein [Candidatus Saccharibacteria bacterium]